MVKARGVDERIVSVEALVNQLVKKVGNPSIVADAAVTQGLLAFSTFSISTDATAMTADTLGQRESGSPAGPQYRDDRPAPSSSTTNPGDAGRKATTCRSRRHEEEALAGQQQPGPADSGSLSVLL